MSSFKLVVAGEGLEPSQTESESVVLPLHNPALNNSIYYNKNNKNVNINCLDI